MEVVVTDGSQSYGAAIARHLGHAAHVVDRFHVVRWFASDLIEVRRRVQRVGEEGESPEFSLVIFRTCYLQLARAGHLSSEQFARLSLALTEDPALWHAWRLPQQLYDVYDADSENEAAARIESFVHAWAVTPIPEFRSVLKALAQGSPRSSPSIVAAASPTAGSKARTTSLVSSSASPTASSTRTTSPREPCFGVLL